MAGSVESQEVAARDDAQLRPLGIKPELRRTLGFLSNFAIAFSFISVSTGSYGNFSIGIGQAGRPSSGRGRSSSWASWSSRSCFAELASHFPVAGSIYQWSKRLSNRTLGLVHRLVLLLGAGRDRHAPSRSSSATSIDGIHAAGRGQTRSSTRRRPDSASQRCSRSSPSRRWSITTLINAFGVRLLSILNNIGVATEILGMVVFALILLFFANNQSPSRPRSTRPAPRPPRAATTCRRSPSACSWRCSSCTGSTRPARSARRRSTPAGRRPRGVIWSVVISGVVGTGVPRSR